MPADPAARKAAHISLDLRYRPRWDRHTDGPMPRSADRYLPSCVGAAQEQQRQNRRHHRHPRRAGTRRVKTLQQRFAPPVRSSSRRQCHHRGDADGRADLGRSC